jgi:hypothetical protein
MSDEKPEVETIEMMDRIHLCPPGRWHHTQETWTSAKIVHLPLKMGQKKAQNMYGRSK